MTPAFSIETTAQVLAGLGWRQFFFDEQFNLCPPYQALAQLCGLAPKDLQDRPLLEIFTPAGRPELSSFLSKETSVSKEPPRPGRPPLSVALWLQGAHEPPRPVEVLLFLRPNGAGRSVGFMRPVPEAVTDLLQDHHLSPESCFEKTARLSRLMTTTLDLDELLQAVMDRLGQDFGYEYGAVFLMNSQETTLTLQAAFPPEVISKADRQSNLVLEGQSIISRAVALAEPVYCNDIAGSVYDRLDYFPARTQSEIAVPLVVDKQTVGVLVLQSSRPRRYRAKDVSLLQTIASQLALAVGNMRLIKERDKRLSELGAFNQIGMIIAEYRDLDTILSNIVQRVKALFQVEAVSLLVLENTVLRFVAAAGAVADDIEPFTLDWGPGIAWSVQESQKTIRIDDVRAVPGRFNEIDQKIGFTTHSLLAVPVRLQERTLGVLEAMNRLDGQSFDQDDEIILEFIASSIAVSIENARLFEQTRRQVDRTTGLLQASYALSTLDLQDILDTIVHQAGNLLEAAHTVVYLADYEAGQLQPTAVYSVGDMQGLPTPPFAFDEGTVGWVIKHRRPLRINDLQQDDRFVPMSPQSKRVSNLVAVPLMVKGEAIGVLEATRKRSGGDFTVTDNSILSAFASQAAIAIHNARLYQETQRQIRALTTLTQTSENITKASGFDQLLDIVLNSALSIMGADGGAIILVESGSQSLRIEAAQGLEQTVVDAFNRLKVQKNIGTFGETYRRRVIIEIEDSASDPRIFMSDQMGWDLPPSFTNVPLNSGPNFIGLITLYGLPSQDNRSLLQAVADMAAVAIAKARLFDETEQRLAEVSTLYTLAEQMTRVLDLDRVVEYSVNILRHALDCSGCSLFLKEKEGAQGFALRASAGRPLASRGLELEMTYIARLSEELTAKPYPIYIKDVKAPDPAGFPRFVLPPGDAGSSEQQGQPPSQMRAVMIVPLVAKDEVIGTLAISDNRQPDAFGQSEGRLLTIAAAQISTAIENIRLYDHLERRAIELEAALQEVAEVNRLKSEFVQNVSHELRTPLTFILSYIELILEGSLGEISETIREKLEIVSRKTKITTRLVDDIISLQKLETGNLHLSLTTPYELVTRTAHGATARAAQEGLEIVVECEPDLPEVQVDIDRVGQVFDNLVSNALKFSPAGSIIHISAGQDQAMIKFTVQDHGIGIPADKLEKVFERFYQVDGSTTRRYGGAGLGLAIIKQIVEAHGGRITVDSVVGEGTIFTFWLPVYQPAGESSVSHERTP